MISETHDATVRWRAPAPAHRSTGYNRRTLPPFDRSGGALHCEGVPLADLAAAYGTPLYVYSAAAIAARYRDVDEAFAGYPHALHYALKANSTLGIARLLRSLGAAADANSGGEIEVALRAGFTPAQIVFTGVGKTDAELARAIDLGLRSINAESEGETRAHRRDRRGTPDAGPRRGARQPRHRRAQPSAHLDRPEDQQVRRRASTTLARCACACTAVRASRSSACTATSARRSPTSSRCGAPPRRS